MEKDSRLKLSLLLLRISVFVVMFVWMLDKFMRPGHAAAVYANFYYLKGIGVQVMYGIAIAELILIVAFLFGIFKTFTYGLVLILHAISTFSSYKQYMAPFQGPHLLFFAAWPMLAACIALFLLRRQDTWIAISR